MTRILDSRPPSVICPPYRGIVIVPTVVFTVRVVEIGVVKLVQDQKSALYVYEVAVTNLLDICLIM